MLNEEAAQNLFKQIHDLWIYPEVLRRKEEARLPEDFKIKNCLIKLPKDNPPIVEFNGEIGWAAVIKKPPGTAFKKDQPIYLHDIEKVDVVKPPEVNGQRVAFVYLFWSGNSHQIIFDFSPNIPGELQQPPDDKEWQLGKMIAESLQDALVEKTIHLQDNVQVQLQKMGLWAAPSLMPYPLSKIAVQLSQNDVEGAQKTFLGYCTPVYLKSISEKWWDAKQFEVRKQHILDAIDAHERGKYSLSIHAILPHIEGIISDWIYAKLPASEVPWRQESKTKKFRDLVLDKPPSSATYQRIVQSAVSFILGGPVLQTFKTWVSEIDKAFPNRHVVEHGKYDVGIYTEENSAKLFILLDTLYHIISGHPEP